MDNPDEMDGGVGGDRSWNDAPNETGPADDYGVAGAVEPMEGEPSDLDVGENDDGAGAPLLSSWKLVALILASLALIGLVVGAVIKGFSDEDPPGGGARTSSGGAVTRPDGTIAAADPVKVPKVVVIKTVGKLFVPQSVTITKGTKVRFLNSDGSAHTVAPDTEGAFPASPETFAKERGQHVVAFDTVGTFGYHCALHGTPGAGMHGTIVVTATDPTKTSAVATIPGTTGRAASTTAGAGPTTAPPSTKAKTQDTGGGTT